MEDLTTSGKILTGVSRVEDFHTIFVRLESKDSVAREEGSCFPIHSSQSQFCGLVRLLTDRDIHVCIRTITSYIWVADGEERFVHLGDFVLDEGRGVLRVLAPPANFTTGTDGRTIGLGVDVGGVRVVLGSVRVALVRGVVVAVQRRASLPLVVLVAVRWLGRLV